MVVLDFLRRARSDELWWMIVFTIVAGFANALLVVAVNEVAALVAAGYRPNLWTCLTFVGAFAAFYQCDKLAVLRANAVIERLLKELRTEIVDKLRCSELQVIERLGRGSLYSILSQGTNQLSVTFPLLIESFQQAVLLGVSLIYLGYLSQPALLLFILAVAIGFAGYRQIEHGYRDTLEEISAQEAEMLDAVADIVHGGKELRLNAERSDAVFRWYRRMSRSMEALLAKAGGHSASMILLNGFVVYLMLGGVGFVFPQYISMPSTIVFQLVPTLLFCMNAVVKIATQSPMFVQAEVGLRAILDIERRLEAAGGVSPARARELAARYREFRVINYTRVTLGYRDATGTCVFTLGPCDMTLRRGEVVFLIGGNGSGKSTVMRLMTGLYRPDEGEIAVDGVPVVGNEVAGLRELFSAIFVDFHLFDQLYGLEWVDPQEVRRLIDEMGLQGKVSFRAGRFSDLRLSTGQRKRLALIAALLEDRPIYAFDEWSAEQDVHFREHFYTRIIPGLKAKGKTVVAVTHDDRYWHLADRVIKLDLGSVVWERTGTTLLEDV